MKHILLIVSLLPYLLFSQGTTKPKTGTGKPATTATKKPATQKPATQKPAVKKAGTGTAVKKPATTKKPVIKKANPQVVKLTEKAYEYYRDSKDALCEKTIKQILALDPKNKDAFLLRANLAMFGNKYDEMWKNLDKIYKYNMNEPEIYSNFAVTHLNYMFLSDSFKRLLCRKTIKLAPGRSDGYVNLGMVAMAGGFYDDAISCFNISMNKQWKDTFNRVLLQLYYARCYYGVGDTLEAIKCLERTIPRVSGNERYTAIFLRAKYKLDYGDTGVLNDLDTLNAFAPSQPEIWVLNAKYLSKTNRKDSACIIAKRIRMTENGEGFDLSEYCTDLTAKLDLLKFRKLTYSMGEREFILNISQFNYPGGISFKWERGYSVKESGIVSMSSRALDSALDQTYIFTNDTEQPLESSLNFWLSRTQYKDIVSSESTKISAGGGSLYAYRKLGHEQIEVFDAENKEILLNCIVLSDGVNRICILDDPENPMIIKFESESLSYVLSKFE